MAAVRIKQEGSAPEAPPSACSGKKDAAGEKLNPQANFQLSCAKRGKPLNSSSGGSSRNLPPSSALIQPANPPPTGAKMAAAGDQTKSFGALPGDLLPPKKPFECEQCEKSFNCRSHLIMHQRVHTRERPYVCECGKTFTQSSNLFRHQRSHRHHRLQLGLHSFTCPHCDQDFPELARLLAHQGLAHSQAEPFLDVA